MVVTMGGFEPPLDRLSTCCLCQVGLHGHWSLRVDSNHHLTGQEPGVLHSHYGGKWSGFRGPSGPPEVNSVVPQCWRSRCDRGARTSTLERMAGFEPAPQGLEGPQATVTPHSLWFGLRVSNPSLRAGDAGCIPHTQAEHGPVSLTGPWTFRQLSKTPLLRAGGQQGIRTR